MKRIPLILVLFTLTALALAGKNPLNTSTSSLTSKIDSGKEEVVETFSEPIVGGFTVDEYQLEQQEHFNFLMTARIAGSEDRPITVQPSQEDLDRMTEYNCPDCGNGGKKLMVGVNLPAKVSVNFAEIAKGIGSNTRAFGSGMVRGTGDGGYVWTSTVESIGAKAVRIHFTNVKLAPGDQLFVYSELGEVSGPYDAFSTVNGELWSNALTGSTVSVQLHHGGSPAGGLGGTSSQFIINDISHLGEDFLIPDLLYGDTSRSFCSINASCVVDAQCNSGVSAVQDARQGVAHILFSVGASQFICSGGLLNDTDTSTSIPYFLTANHCVSTSASASSIQFYWQFRTTSCTTSGTCPTRTSAASTSGASLLRTNSTSDYTLVQCNQTPPAGSILMGWTSAAVANSNGTQLYRISHPKGAPQAYSQHNVSTSKGTCASWPRGAWIYEQDITGATEGGSSGSPVVNGSGQVVGQLSGACGTNPSNPCASSSNATVDGAFANYFSNVDDLLDPSTGGGGCTNMGFVGTAGPLSGTSSFWGSSFQFFSVSVPAGACELKVSIAGGTGDADLYVRFGAQPTTSTYDCRPYLNGNNETCTFPTPQAGTWHIGINAFSTYSGVTLTATY